MTRVFAYVYAGANYTYRKTRQIQKVMWAYGVLKKQVTMAERCVICEAIFTRKAKGYKRYSVYASLNKNEFVNVSRNITDHEFQTR